MRLKPVWLSREVLAVLAMSLLLTVGVWVASLIQVARMAETRFSAESRSLVGEVVNRIADYDHILRAAAALLELDPTVNRAAWQAFIVKLHVERDYPGIQGIGFAKRVQGPELESFIATERAGGVPDYTPYPAGVRPLMFPVIYVAPPTERNRRVCGYDPYSDPARRAAMEAALESGDIRATPNIRLIQEPEADLQAGFVMYFPVFATQHPADLEERRQSLMGFIYASFRMTTLMDNIIGRRASNPLEIAVYSGKVPTKEARMFDSRPDGPRPASRYHRVETLDIHGAPWTVVTSSNQTFEEGIDGRLPWVVLAGGLLVSGLAAVVVGSLAGSRERAKALAVSNAALEQARAEADGANIAKSRFLAAASHDLRQPLQSLGLYLNLLMLKLSTDEQRSFANRVLEGLETTGRLLNSLMDISALETGMIRPNFMTVRLAELVERIAVEMRPEADAKGLKLKVHLCGGAVETDPVLVERIIRNLVSNALRYTETGGILLAARPVSGAFRLEVWDTGPGIPEDQLQLIFEDFYQVGNPERDRRKGLGLGLATVARLARLLGYRLEVRSRLGRGTVFRVDLPKVGHALARRAA